MAKYKIAIIGAGPAGCTLARLLLHKEIDVDITIFEGEAGLDARTQGGTLDLHANSGQAALKECGLYDDFRKLARYDAEAFRVTNKHFQSFIHFPGTKGADSSRGRPEIDRIQLRRLLLDSLPKDLIRWNHKTQRVSEDIKDGGYKIHFASHEDIGGFDLIIGGDGCWSKVRPSITKEAPFYAGVSGVSFQISRPETRCPDLVELVDRGSLFAFSDHKGITTQHLGSGQLNVAFWKAQSEEWIHQFKIDDIEAMKAAVLEETVGWDPRLRKLVEMADTDAVTRNLYMLPVGVRWENVPGLTLLGDAAHVQTPFAEEGVNLAMSDAMQLAKAIERATKLGTKEALVKEVKWYEEDMFKRAKVVQETTWNMMSATLLDEDSLDGNIEKYITTAAGDEVPWVFMPVFKFAVWVYFTYWRWRNPKPSVEMREPSS